MIWKSVLKNEFQRRVAAHMAEDRILRPKRKEDHPLREKRLQLFKDLAERMEREYGPKPKPPKREEPYDPEHPYRKWLDISSKSPEQSEIWDIERKIDFEYRHGVGFFQGQEPEDIKGFHNFPPRKYDEAFYREKGYEPPQNKKHMKRDD